MTEEAETPTDIQFIISEKLGDTISYACPKCDVEGKLAFGRFREQYAEINCKCGQTLLLKLEFVPSIEVFISAEKK